MGKILTTTGLLWLIFALLFTSGFAASAQKAQEQGKGQGQGYHMMSMWWERPQVLKQLKLTNEQVSSIKAIYNERTSDLQRLRSELREQGKTLGDLFSQDKLDQPRIDDQINVVSTGLASLVKAEMQMNARMMQELTPGQRQKLVNLQKQWMEGVRAKKKH